MEVIEDQTNKKNAKQYRHCLRNTLLPYEYDFTGI